MSDKIVSNNQPIGIKADRKNAMINLYQTLLKAPIEIDDFMGDETLLSERYQPVIRGILRNIRTTVKVFDHQLNDWEFDRLGFVEQAILLLAYAESKVIKTPKVVLIDEAVELAKEFGDEDSYKLINATLDKVL